MESAGGAWQTTVLQCRAESGDSFIPVQLAWPSTPPRPLEQWCQGFYCPTPGLGPSAVPSSCLRDLSALLRRRGQGRGRKGTQWGSKKPECPAARPAAHVLFIRTVRAGLADVPSCSGCQRDQCSSYLWLRGPGQGAVVPRDLGSRIAHRGCASPGSTGSPELGAGKVPGRLCCDAPGTAALQPSESCCPRGACE